MASSASAELPRGTVVGGFRVERVVGRGSRSTVYRATQPSLDRRVALKVLHDDDLAERVRRLSWPEHPGAVRLFATGVDPCGPWLAMQLVTGEPLVGRRASLDEVGAALAAAHAHGVVHGNLTAASVLLDRGRPLLTGLGLGPDGATVEDDQHAFAAVVRDHGPRQRGPGGERRRRIARAVLAVAVAGAAVGLTVGAATEGGAPRREAAPGPAGTPPAAAVPPPAGTRRVGSALAAGPQQGVDCGGGVPSGASRACTISQRTLAGRPVVIAADGTISSWAVRGASGRLALQVLRGRGTRLEEVDRSPPVTVAGPGIRTFRADLAVAAGDRVALVVGPGATVGLRGSGRDAGAGATVDRWFGPLLEPARPPEQPAGTGLDRELLLRVDVAPRAGAVDVEPLGGARAAAARPGRRRGEVTVGVGGDEVRTVAVVVLGAGVALDLTDGARRLARVPVRGADGRGRLLGLTAGPGRVTVRWRGPDGRVVTARRRVTLTGLR